MKDLIFTIYRYKIGEIPKQGELFPEEGRKNPKDYASHEEFFESFLPEKGRFLDLWEEAKKSKGKEETVEKDTHKNEILQHEYVKFPEKAHNRRKVKKKLRYT